MKTTSIALALILLALTIACHPEPGAGEDANFLSLWPALQKLPAAPSETEAPSLGARAYRLFREGVAFQRAYDYQRARKKYEQGLQLRLRQLHCGPPPDSLLEQIIRDYQNLGNLWLQDGYYDRAGAYTDTCLRVQRHFDTAYGFENHYRRGNLYRLMGNLYTEVGELSKAGDFLERAYRQYSRCLEEATDAADRTRYFTSQVRTLVALSYLYVTWEESDSIIHYAGRGLELLQAALAPAERLARREYAALCLNRGIGHELADELPAARRFFDEARRAYERQGAVWEVAKVYQNRSIVARKEKKYEAAHRDLTAAVRLNRQNGFDDYLVDNYIARGLLYLEEGRCAAAQTELDRAVDLLLIHPDATAHRNRSDNPDWDRSDLLIRDKNDLLEALYGRARAWEGMGRPLAAEATYRTAVGLIEHTRSEYQDRAAKIRFAALSQKVFEAAIANSLAPAIDRPAQAFAYAEKSKVFTLLEGVKTYQALARVGLDDPALLEREIDLRNRIEEARRAYLWAETEGEQETHFLRRQALLKERDALLRRFERDFPDYYRLKYDYAVPSLHHLQEALLAPDQALVEFFCGEAATYRFTLPPGGTLQVDRIAVGRDSLQTLVATVNDYLARRSADDAAYGRAACRLYRLLLAPVEAETATRRVLLIPDAALGYLPFDALLRAYDPAWEQAYQRYPFLGRHYRFSYAYSATMLEEMQQRAAGPHNGRLLAVGLDEFAEQVECVAAVLGDSWLQRTVDRRVGAQARLTALRRELADYPFLHFSVHGSIDDREPSHSYLELFDGRLYLSDLYNTPLRARMVVTAACDAGIGRLYRGEGIMSLARGFSHAGAGSVITTLWQVNGRATQTILTAFYEYLQQGLAKDEALFRAKQRYLKERPGYLEHPNYWTGLIAIGDMEAVEIGG